MCCVIRAVTFKLASDDELMMEKIFKVTIDTRVAPGGKIEVLQVIIVYVKCKCYVLVGC